MNLLLVEMRRGLLELEQGMKGALTMTPPMETLLTALATDSLPADWKRLSSPSQRGLRSWFSHLQARYAQLLEWTTDLAVPKSVWLPGRLSKHPQTKASAVADMMDSQSGCMLLMSAKP